MRPPISKTCKYNAVDILACHRETCRIFQKTKQQPLFIHKPDTWSPETSPKFEKTHSMKSRPHICIKYFDSKPSAFHTKNVACARQNSLNFNIQQYQPRARYLNVNKTALRTHVSIGTSNVMLVMSIPMYSISIQEITMQNFMRTTHRYKLKQKRKY